MKMPGGAIVDARKLTGYCLNPEHPRGKTRRACSRRSASLLRTLTTYELRS
jgi:hypothetical protein